MRWRGSLFAVVVAFAAVPVLGSSFTVTTSAFLNGGNIPKLDAAGGAQCGGRNISPPLHFTGLPAPLRSMAVVVFDTDAGHGHGFVHWVAYGIAPSVTTLPPGFGSAPSPGFTGGVNDAQTQLYFGPCPPAGDPPHHYVFTVYALDLAPARLQPGLTRAMLLHAIAGHVLAQGQITGLYGR